MEQHLRVTWDDVIDDGMVDVSGKCHLMYGDFDVADGDARVYEEVADVPSLIPRMEENLADYNSESKVRMCSFACLCACQLCVCMWLFAVPHETGAVRGCDRTRVSHLPRAATGTCWGIGFVSFHAHVSVAVVWMCSRRVTCC